MVKTIVIGGVASGVGKTTIATGLAAALVRRGYAVQTFKAGPDYIDPSYLALASGAPCRNLDTWLLPRETVVELFHRATLNKDIAIVEGVMGLFDGHSPDSEAGSTAELAKLLKAPVILVADASKVGRSIAATVMGFQAFDPALNLAGVILNGVAGEGHLYFVKGPVERATRLPVLGHMPHREDLKLPERHLGLIPTSEGKVASGFLDKLARQAEGTLDVERIAQMAQRVSLPYEPRLFPGVDLAPIISIAVARDKAFNFYYQDSLDLLAAWGAEIVPFSPLSDERLPDGVAGVYIGGGFPELFAEELAANEGMKRSLRRAASQGMPIYGECGGLMYLGERLTDFEGRAHSMVHLVPASSTMSKLSLSIGYCTVEALSDGPLLIKGERVRGHEFHWSVLDESPHPEFAAYAIADQQGRLEGFRVGSVLASYVHLHMGSKAELAPNFVQSCRDWAKSHR